MLTAIFISAIFRILVLGDYQFVRSVELSGDMHYSDPIGNVYVVKGNALKKINPSHLQAANYTNTFLGNIYSIDVSDPLRILLFYKDYNQIVWVDNFLSEISSPVRLDELGIDQAELICSSSQGGFWVFNTLNNQLQFFDVNLRLIHESPSLNMLTGPDISPSYMIEKSRAVYLNVPGTGILVFDRFGNYSKTIAIEVPQSFQVTERYLYFMEDTKLLSFDLQTAELARLEIPDLEKQNPLQAEAILKVELQPDFLFLYTRKGYSVYKTNH